MHLSLSIKNHFLESDLNRKINKTRRRSVVPSTEPNSDDETILHKYLLFSFLIISFGYMLPWTSLGSLISYYKYKYSAEFYVKIYCAYYLPGLPVALVQYQYDEYWNSIYGSKFAYKWRGCFCFIAMIAVLISLTWIESEMILIYMFTLLGISSWLCHGTATMYASLFPATAIAFLQIGFRSPEIFVITADHYLDLGKAATADSLNLFYKLTAFLVFLSLLVWLYTVDSRASVLMFADKDRRGKTERDPEKNPLLHSNTAGEEVEGDGETRFISTNNDGSDTVPIARDGNPLNRAKVLLSAIETLTQKEDVFNTVSPLCAALFVTMWSSIFQASFFAYVNSVSSESRNIEKTLYFIRLICDLLGRPLTFLPRPAFLTTNNQLLIAALLRSLLLIVFFSYISVPSFPKSDAFICILVGVFSMASGYLVVLIYEYAASNDLTKAERAHATNILNIGFQFAAFLAVLMSVAVSLTGWLT